MRPLIASAGQISASGANAIGRLETLKPMDDATSILTDTDPAGEPVRRQGPDEEPHGRDRERESDRLRPEPALVHQVQDQDCVHDVAEEVRGSGRRGDVPQPPMPGDVPQADRDLLAH